MQADWEFEIGSGAPIIDAAWAGLIDLRNRPERVGEIAETAAIPALASALLRLNSASSPAWTAKCDVWTPESFDGDELDSATTEACCALACYIDLLPRVSVDWSTAAQLESFCRGACDLLSAIPARSCRADLVVRRALLDAETESLGITAYLCACGASAGHAATALSAAVAALADCFCPNPAD